MEEEIHERFKTYMAYKGLTFRSLVDILGVSEAIARHYRSGTTKPTGDEYKIFAAHMHIDLGWLLTGVGINPMPHLGVAEPTTQYHKAGASDGHPTLTNNTLRGLMSELATRFNQADRFEMIEVEGSSMEPTVHSGDLLLCKAISVEDIGNGHDGDPSPRVYVIFTNRADLAKERPSGKWVKRITFNKHTNRFTCRSDNIDSIEAFHTFQISKKEIFSAWYPVLRLTWNLSNPHRDLYSRLDELESRIEMLEENNR